MVLIIHRVILQTIEFIDLLNLIWAKPIISWRLVLGFAVEWSFVSISVRHDFKSHLATVLKWKKKSYIFLEKLKVVSFELRIGSCHSFEWLHWSDTYTYYLLITFIIPWHLWFAYHFLKREYIDIGTASAWTSGQMRVSGCPGLHSISRTHMHPTPAHVGPYRFDPPRAALTPP